MTPFAVPTKNEVSENNQAIFANLEKGLGFVPNLYATFAYSDNALGNYLALQNAKSSLKAKEREVINLVVSQFNECEYCLAAHTTLGKMNGFTDKQIIELRQGYASFDSKLDALAKATLDITANKGKTDGIALDNFFAAGYTKENLIDTLVVIGDKIVSNYLHAVTQIPVDFPAAPALEEAYA